MAEHKTGDFAGCIFWAGTVGLTKFEFQQEFQCAEILMTDV